MFETIEKFLGSRSKERVYQSMAQSLTSFVVGDFLEISKQMATVQVATEKKPSRNLDYVCTFLNQLDQCFAGLSDKEIKHLPVTLQKLRVETRRDVDGVWRATGKEPATLDNVFFGKSRGHMKSLRQIMNLTEEQIYSYEHYRAHVVNSTLNRWIEFIDRSLPELRGSAL